MVLHYHFPRQTRGHPDLPRQLGSSLLATPHRPLARLSLNASGPIPKNSRHIRPHFLIISLNACVAFPYTKPSLAYPPGKKKTAAHDPAMSGNTTSTPSSVQRHHRLPCSRSVGRRLRPSCASEPPPAATDPPYVPGRGPLLERPPANPLKLAGNPR